MRLLFRLVRSGINILLLFSALVLTPLLFLSHFSAGLAGAIGSLADNYLPHPTLYSSERRARARTEAALREQQRIAASERALLRKRVAARNPVAARKGKRILVRGAGALAVGWVPVLGLTADVVSLGADYADICDLFATIDELSAMLYFPESSLYLDNHCDAPEIGMEKLREAAQHTHFPWQDETGL